jgi:hypothetical protein
MRNRQVPQTGDYGRASDKGVVLCVGDGSKMGSFLKVAFFDHMLFDA